jgi:hypothetical protein
VIITHVLYAGDEDDEHARAVSTTVGHRGNLAIQMAFKKADPSARLPIKPFITEFLARAEARVSAPATPPGAVVPSAPANSSPSQAPFAVREYLDRIVDVVIGDLPPLTPAEVRWPEVIINDDTFVGW